MIKLIAIDFNGVIVTGSYRDIARELAQESGLDPDQVYNEIYKYHNQAAVGDLPEAEIFPRGLADLGLKKDAQQVWRRHVELTSVRNEEVIAYAQDLRRRGYTVVALSKNTPKIFAETVKLSRITDEFDAIINTYDWRLPKESPEVVRRLMEQFNASNPAEIIIIDDQKKNLTGAEALGAGAIFYVSFDQMKAEIERQLYK